MGPLIVESNPPTGHFCRVSDIYPQFTLLFSKEILLIFVVPAFVSKCAGVCQTAQIGYSNTVFSIELIHYAREKTAPTTLMSTWLTSLIMIKYF